MSQPSTSDAERVVTAASDLAIKGREQRWTHLSLCVLEAVLSLGGTYTATTRACHNYARAATLPQPLAPAAEVAAGAYTAAEQPLSDFVADVERRGSDEFTQNVIEHEQSTSPRGPRKITKAEAALRYARILTDHQIEGFPT